MQPFTCRAHLDEYIIDDDDPGTLDAANDTITYTADHLDSAICIPRSEITTITFERDTTLNNFRFLGSFFGSITLLLIVFTAVLAFANPDPGPNHTMIVLFLLFLIIGGIATTYNFFSHDNYDVIVMSIETDDDRTTVCGRMANASFVDACSTLINSDIPTTNRNPTLESALN